MKLLLVPLSAADEEACRLYAQGGATNHPEYQKMRISLGDRSPEFFWYIAGQFGYTQLPQPVPIDPTHPLARFDTAPSQWAKWSFIEPEEQWALLQKFDNNDVHAHINFWAGQAGFQIHGSHNPDGSYAFRWPKPTPDGSYIGDNIFPDVNGAADQFVAQIRAVQGLPMIAPLG